MRWALLFMWLVASPALGQEQTDPRVDIELDQTEIIPGQSATLRVTVLVPTWMPQPVDFPDFEVPNLRVRLPERATNPTTRLIDGETWSGVSRRYLLSPMVPGVITLPPQSIVVTYAGADAEPIEATIKTGQIRIAGIVPDRAEALDPFIAASNLTMTQELSGSTADLEPGASIIRTVTASMTGASPIVLPKLAPSTVIDGVKFYEDEPRVMETSDQGALSGTRVERSTLMAVGGGSGMVPAVTLDWFNLDTGRVETARIEGFELSVVGAPAQSAQSVKALKRMIVTGLFCAAILTGVLLLVWPRIMRWRTRRRATYLASAAHARKLLLQAIGRRDYSGTVLAMAAWRMKGPPLLSVDQNAIDDCLLRVGIPRFARTDARKAADDDVWESLTKIVRDTQTVIPIESKNELPFLNKIP